MNASKLQSSAASGFGRRQPFVHAAMAAPASTVSADIRLFLTSFTGGLIFMTIFLA